MKIQSVVLAVVIACLVHESGASRILGLFSVPSLSHQVVYTAVVEALAKRGHEIVVLTPDPVHYTDKQFENITEIDVHDLSYEIWGKWFNFATLRHQSSRPVGLLGQFRASMAEIIDEQLSVPEMKAILENPDEHFDLILIESLFIVNFAALWRFNAPVIGISSLTATLSNYDAVGNPSHPLLYADIFSTQVGELNFWQRFDNVLTDLQQRYVHWTYSDLYNKIAKKHFGESALTLEEAERRMSMLFINIHPILNGVRPAVPAIVYLGGSHLKSKKPLPQDLKNFLDKSEQGVIYMSLGSNVKSKDLSFEKLNMFIEVFSELPYNVLWKFENETLPGQPSNVYISKWLPQNDLLDHPNIKVFITQGGQQSMEEAIQSNVPLIGIPFLADQDYNVKRMVNLGIGKGLNIDTVDKYSLKETILDVIQNDRYRLTIKRLSDLVQDQPNTGLERAVWWSEYVIRHGGTEHLRAPTVPLYQYLMLDIIAFVVFTIFAILLIAYFVLAFLIRLYFKPSKLKQL